MTPSEIKDMCRTIAFGIAVFMVGFMVGWEVVERPIVEHLVYLSLMIGLAVVALILLILAAVLPKDQTPPPPTT